MSADLFTLLGASALVCALARCTPTLRPHAVALLACSALYLARVAAQAWGAALSYEGAPSRAKAIAVVLYVLWPGVACALTRALHRPDGRAADESPRDVGPVDDDERRQMTRGHPVRHWRAVAQKIVDVRAARLAHLLLAPLARLARRVVGGVAKTRDWTRERVGHAAILAPFAAYALALAYLGAYLAPWWPLPLLLPNAAPVLYALATCRRPVTWAQRGAYVLPCSACADMVSTWAGAPDVVRVAVGVGTWALFVACCVAEVGAPRMG